MRLSSRGDQIAAQHGLSAFTAVLREYLSYRRTSSLALSSPTHPLAIESDSQSLLNLSLEKLHELGDGFLRSGQIDNARSVVDSYDALAAEAVQIEFVNHPSDNPIAYQLAYSLKGYVDRAVRLDDNEVPFRAIETFVRIGEHAASRSNATLLYTVAQSLASISVHGATSDAWFIAERCYGGQIRLLHSLFQWRGDAQICFDEVLKQLLVLHQGPVPRAVMAGTPHAGAIALRKPFDDLQKLVIWIRTEHGQRDASGQRDLSSAFASFVEPLYTHLRSICDTIDLESVYVDTVAELIVQTVRTLTALEREDDRHRTAEYVQWFICLPSWIGDRSQVMKSPRGLEKAIDAACKVALRFIAEDGPSDRVLAAMDTAVWDCEPGS